MTECTDHAGAVARIDELRRLRGVGRERLLAQHVASGLDRFEREREMGVGWRRDRDCVDVWQRERLRQRAARVRDAELAGLVRGGLEVAPHQGDHVEPCRAERGHLHPTPEPSPDDRDAHSHHHTSTSSRSSTSTVAIMVGLTRRR